MLTPHDLAKSNTEHGHQKAVICWSMTFAPVALRPVLQLLHAIPNGGARDIITAGKLKSEGVKPGIPDLHLPVARRGFIGLYIEMKKPAELKKKGGGLSDDQIKVIAALQAENNFVMVCYDWEHAVRVLEGYLS